MKQLLLSIATAILFTQASFSQDCIWTGAADSLWQNPANWSCGKVPDANTDVYVLGGTIHAPLIEGDVVCRNLCLLDSMVQYLKDAYVLLSGDAAYGNRLSSYYTVDNDETMLISGGAHDNSRRSLARYDLSPSNMDLLAPFNRLYFSIFKTNFCIKFFGLKIASASGSATAVQNAKRWYGEALTLKALLYFELIKHWGDVPYTDSATIAPAFTFQAFAAPNLGGNTDRDSTYDKILNELLLAEDYLPWKSELATLGDTLDERITKGSAKALRARIALFAGGYALRQDGTMRRRSDYLNYYQVAKDECLSLMHKREEHTLATAYKTLWQEVICAHKIDDGSGEIMLQVKMENLTGQSNSKLGYYNGPRAGGQGAAAIGLLPTYFYLFDSADTRRDVTAAPYDVGTDNITKTGVALHQIRDGKFRRNWITNPEVSPTSTAQYFGLNWPLIRFADVLLMFAEADNELNNGPTTVAIEAFEEVRKRGYGNNAALIGMTPTGKSDFFNAIVKERALEFGGEGIRKFDLIRWNLLETKILETRSNINKMANKEAPYESLPLYMYYFTGTTADNSAMWVNSLYHPAALMVMPGATRVNWTNTANAGSNILTATLLFFASNFTAGKCELYPYPQWVKDANPQLLQNFGY
ncbi:MAG TPA: RagB/SusD family nutrient uptake outer membrane protein [Ferruginibacter sp.]|nr:RagB/SusD family nutrient uptake outer membrane protein [Ferruginibacter sp.]HMP20496.1 RagB/SusD family nutrient uptake outer membrane protein [Ferruginibacter sp.]